MRFIPIHEIINLPLLAENDFLKRGKGRLLTWSKWVWDDLNLQVVRQAIRKEFQIDKRTRTVNLPCDELDLCSVSVRHKGVIYPVFRNDRLHDDIVDVPADKDCNCEYRCGFKLCNTIKGYEAITTIKDDTNPNGSPVSFTCVSKKVVDKNGVLYLYDQYPLHIFTNGVWTSTILYTDQKETCKLEVDKNGCICDTDQNVNLLCDACGWDQVNSQIPVGGTADCPPNPNISQWIFYCNSKFEFFAVQCGQMRFLRGCDNIYNITELGNRLKFPHDFPFDKVLIRYYGVPNLKDLEVPFIAVDTFVTGLKWYDVRWNEKKQALEQKFGADYSRQKWGLFETLNKYTLAETGMMLAPPRHMPSYIRRDDFSAYSVWNMNINTW